MKISFNDLFDIYDKKGVNQESEHNLRQHGVSDEEEEELWDFVDSIRTREENKRMRA